MMGIARAPKAQRKVGYKNCIENKISQMKVNLPAINASFSLSLIANDKYL